MSTVATLPAAQRAPCAFTRLAATLARHKGDYMAVAADVADDRALTTIIKSAVAAGTTSDANWATTLSISGGCRGSSRRGCGPQPSWASCAGCAPCHRLRER